MGLIPMWIGYKLWKKTEKKLEKKYFPTFKKDWAEMEKALKSDKTFEAWQKKQRKKK